MSLIGLVDGFVVRKIPGVTGPFTVYLHLTDGIEGHEYSMTVELHDLSNDTIIAKAAGPKVKWAGRLLKLNLFIPVPPLRIQHTGTYDFVVFANQQEIDRQEFGVMVPPSPNVQEEEGHE